MENYMSRYIQACDALMLSKKPWRWITVLLIILGDVSTLTRHAFYRKLYEYIQSVSH